MKKTHNNKLNMYLGVLGVLKEGKDIIEASPVLSRSVKDLDSLVTKMIETGTMLQKGSKPVTKAKEALRKELAEEAAVMAGILKAYAFDSEDVELSKEADYSFTKLYFVRHQVTKHRSMKIRDLMIKHRKALSPYLSNEGQIDRLVEIIEKYDNVEGEAAAARAEVFAGNRAVDSLVRKLDALLKKKIDHLVYALKNDHPNFYNQYRNARQIIDL